MKETVTVVPGVKWNPATVSVPPGGTLPELIVITGVGCGTGLAGGGDGVDACVGEAVGVDLGVALGLAEALGVGVGLVSATRAVTCRVCCAWQAPFQQTFTTWSPTAMSSGTVISTETLPFESARNP